MVVAGGGVVFGERLREFAWVLDLATAGGAFVAVRLFDEAAGMRTSSATSDEGVGAFTSDTEDWRTASDSRASFSMLTRLSL